VLFVCSAGDILELWFPKKLWQKAIKKTNEDLRSAGIKETDYSELMLHIAAQLYVAADNHTGSFTDYFGTAPDAIGGQKADFNVHGITMARTRELRRRFHWGSYDPSGLDTDPFHHVRAYVEGINEHFQNLWVPGPHLTIDESMVAWMGRGMPGWIFIKRKPKPGTRRITVGL
jgi:hypothetical protein